MKELAENRKDARPRPTWEDAQYNGVARHPLGRRWLRRRLREEMRATLEAGPGDERERHRATVNELRAQLRPKED